MKALLLAAGRGTRISKFIKEVPKSTLPIYEDKPLIRHTVEAMLAKGGGIEPIVCVGYKRNHIEKALEGLPVKFYYNPFYAITNSIASLWFMREELDDDMIVMNADVYFSDGILDRLLESRGDAVLVSDKSEGRIAEGDYFFSLDDDNKIIRYGKDIVLEQRSCEYVGMAKLSKEFGPTFRERMEKMIDEQQYDGWWENVLYSFTEEKADPVSVMDVDGAFWSEIDFIDDYNRILAYVEKNKIGSRK